MCPQDNASSVTIDGRYYSRVAGGETTNPDSTRVILGDCKAPEAVWAWQPSANSSYGQLEAIGGLPGYCLGLWDLWRGACISAIYAQAVPCSEVGALGCPVEAQLWAPGDSEAEWPLLSALSYGGGTPFPGPYLTDSGIPGGLYSQPAVNSSLPLRGVSQVWQTTVPGGGPAANTTIKGFNGTCLMPAPLLSYNVWARWLSNGDVALLLVNFAVSPATVSCDAECMATVVAPRATLPPQVWSARDVWEQRDAGTIMQSVGYTSPALPADGGSILLRLTPIS
jgi:hypothetical protein